MRQHLKGLAKLRREFVTPIQMVERTDPVYTRWGDLIEGAVVMVPGTAKVDPTRNLEKLGSGCFSDVYALDDTRVLKVTKRKGDKGFDAYSRVCQANPHNPYFPRIYYRGVWGDKSVYVMERLNPLHDDSPYGQLHNAIEAYKNCGDYVRLSCPVLQEAAQLLTAIPVDDGVAGSLDLKYDNTMQRADGSIVIVDPWFSYSS